MTAGFLTLVLVVVGAASALNLALGAAWVLAVGALGLLRRRVHAAPLLALALVVVAGALAHRAGGLAAGLPGSYAAGVVERPLGGGGGPSAAPDDTPADEAVRSLPERAAAVVAWSGRLDPWRGSAPGETAAVEAAARRLALRVAAPGTEGGTAGADVRAALERAEAAVRALVQAVTGAGVAATVERRLHYAEAAGWVRREDRYEVVAAPPLALVALDVRGLPDGGGAVVARTVVAEVGGVSGPPVGAEGQLVLPEGATRVLVVDRLERAARAAAFRSALRPIAFSRVALPEAAARPGTLLARVRAPGLEGTLAVPVTGLDLAEVTAPGHALFHVSRAGPVSTAGGHDRWEPARVGPEAADQPAPPLWLELTPATVLLRNPLVAAARGYLYRPNLAAALAVTGLAALTWILIARRPPAAP